MIYIIVSFFNEEKTVKTFLTKLIEVCDTTLRLSQISYSIICIDDYSTDETSVIVKSFENEHLISIRNEINIGQRDSLLKGLGTCIADSTEDDVFCFIDGDGEDNPEHIVALLERLSGSNVCMAKRIRRSEGVIFRFFYQIYKFLFVLVSGVQMNVGNFSVFDKKAATWLLFVKRYHIAASFLNSKFLINFVPLERCKRIDGKSKIGFVGLVMHAYLSLIEFLNRIVVRISLLILTFTFILIGSCLFVLYKLIINEAIPGWTSTMFLMLVILIAFCILIILGLMNLILIKEKNNDLSKTQ